MGPKGKKGKLSKSEKEKLKKEEAERKAKEEEEKRLKAEHEEREREEKERQEQEKRRLFEEQERVRHQVEIDELNKQLEDNQKFLNDKRQEMIQKNKWDRYMLCDGRPDPTCKKEINTYINLTKENLSGMQMTNIIKECELVLELIEELDYHINHLDLDLAACQHQEGSSEENNMIKLKVNYVQSKEDLQSLITEAFDSVTFSVLQKPNGMIDSDSLNISLIEKSKHIKLCLWGNAAKNPRVKQIEFEKDSFTMELPKQMALAEIAVRTIYAKFDFLSNKCSTYEFKPKTVLKEEIAVNDQEVNNEDNEEKESLGVTLATPAPSNKALLNVKENMRSKSRNNSVMSIRKGAETSISRISTTDELKIKLEDELSEVLQPDEDFVDENVVNLRSHNIMGPLVFIELLELPMQAKEVSGWIMQQVTCGVLQKIEYGLEDKQDEIETPEASQTSLTSTNNTKSTLAYSLPIMLSFRLDDEIIMQEAPQVVRWDDLEHHWKLDGINDLRYEKDDRLVFFRTKYFGPFAVVQDIYLNMPFESWSLCPTGLNECVLNIKGALVEVNIKIKNSLCCASFPFKLKQLDFLTDKWMSPKQLSKALRDAGVNFFPYQDGEKYVTTSKKVESFVSAVYQHMALSSSCFAYYASKWNSECGEEKIVVKAVESLNGKGVKENGSLYMASPRICCKLNMDENSEEFSTDEKPESQMHPDLYHMLRDGASDDAKQCLRDTSVVFIDCTQQLLFTTNVFVYA